MTILDSVNYGSLTVKQLSDAITSNLITADRLGFTVHTFINKNKIFTGMLKQEGKVIFQNVYLDKYQHMRIARFHGEINIFMWKIEADAAKERMAAERKERERVREYELAMQRAKEQEERLQREKMVYRKGIGFVNPDS